MEESVKQIIELVVNWGTSSGLKIIGAVLILLFGWLLSSWAGRKVKALILRPEGLDDTLAGFGGGAVRFLILAMAIIAVLNNFGIQTASVIAILGSAGIAIGLALQGTLSNVASGIVLLVLRPFKHGDSVDVGSASGSVEEIGLFATHIKTFDGLYVMIPNSQVWGAKITNYTRNPTRRVELEIGISYDDDIDHAIRVIHEILAAEERVLDKPEPLVAVGALGDSAVTLLVRPWTKREDNWGARLALLKAIKERLDVEGISLPYPQQDVHLVGGNAPAQAPEAPAAR